MIEDLRPLTFSDCKDKQIISYQQRFSRKITFKRAAPPHSIFSRITYRGTKTDGNVHFSSIRKYTQDKFVQIFAEKLQIICEYENKCIILHSGKNIRSCK